MIMSLRCGFSESFQPSLFMRYLGWEAIPTGPLNFRPYELDRENKERAILKLVSHGSREELAFWRLSKSVRDMKERSAKNERGQRIKEEKRQSKFNRFPSLRLIRGLLKDNERPKPPKGPLFIARMESSWWAEIHVPALLVDTKRMEISCEWKGLFTSLFCLDKPSRPSLSTTSLTPSTISSIAPVMSISPWAYDRAQCEKLWGRSDVLWGSSDLEVIENAMNASGLSDDS